MTYKPRGDVSKLTKWARDYIGVLEREVTRLDNQIKEMNAPGGEVEWSTGLDEPNSLPNGATITFKTPNGDIDCRIGKYPHQETIGELLVTTRHSISVRPRSGNSISISAKD